MTAPESYVVLLDPTASESALSSGVASMAQDSLPGIRVTRGTGWTATVVGDGVRPVNVAEIESAPEVLGVRPVRAVYRVASREVFGRTVPVQIGRGSAAFAVGGDAPVGIFVSSQWAFTSRARLDVIAPLLREAGCRVFHGGRAGGGADSESERSQGTADLGWLREVTRENSISLSLEVSSVEELGRALPFADLIQVGARNMQDFSLLKELGRTEVPVILRRAAGATVEEFLLAAEYVLLSGNGRVILCESGVRTLSGLPKSRFEINVIPLLRQATHLPILADPSHTAPFADAVPAIAKAAIAAGADGVFLEVRPESVFDSDSTAVDVSTMRRLVADLRPIARAVGRKVEDRGVGAGPLPLDSSAVLRATSRTLFQTIEWIAGAPPTLDVISQWRMEPPPPSWLSPPLSKNGTILARCTSYRRGTVRLSRNIAYVDLTTIDPTIGVLLEAGHLNLGQLFVDPRIEKLDFEFGSTEDAGDLDHELRSRFPLDDDLGLHPYLWRKYHAAIEGVVNFVVIEALPKPVWDRLLEVAAQSAGGGGNT